VPWDQHIQRIIYIGENLYAISQQFIKSADLETVKLKSEINYQE